MSMKLNISYSPIALLNFLFNFLKILLQFILYRIHDFCFIGEVEDHIKLLLEICPEWISIVEIKRGKYVKLDRNKDIQVLNTKIQNLIQERK